jgi:hypothetical protein
MENAKLIETKGARLIGLHAIQAVHDQATQVHKIYVTATWSRRYQSGPMLSATPAGDKSSDQPECNSGN